MGIFRVPVCIVNPPVLLGGSEFIAMDKKSLRIIIKAGLATAIKIMTRRKCQ